ncbi:MAG: hypothetical protein AAB403_00315, partial [Planctomycetota bacterium]
ARQAVLCPSLEFARQELLRGGLKLDVKAIRRITYQCGEGLLRLRRQELRLWREGKLPAGTELRGKRVTVQIDGGRMKIRGPLRPVTPQKEKTDKEGMVLENAPGRSRKRPARTYDAEWREPKLVTICNGPRKLDHPISYESWLRNGPMVLLTGGSEHEATAASVWRRVSGEDSFGSGEGRQDAVGVSEPF